MALGITLFYILYRRKARLPVDVSLIAPIKVAMDQSKYRATITYIKKSSQLSWFSLQVNGVLRAPFSRLTTSTIWQI